MDNFWELYIQGAELPILVGLLLLFAGLPFGLYQAKKRHDSLLILLRGLASDLGGEFFYKSFRLGNLVNIVKDPDCSEYEIKFFLNGRECVILPYAYPSRSRRRSSLTPYATWSTVFKLRMKGSPRGQFSLRYETKKLFILIFQKDVSFNESKINIENREFFNQVTNYNDVVDFIKNIRFISRPFFEIKVSNDLLYIKVDKVENNIDEIKKYLNFMERIARNIENNAN